MSTAIWSMYRGTSPTCSAVPYLSVCAGRANLMSAAVTVGGPVVGEARTADPEDTARPTTATVLAKARNKSPQDIDLSINRSYVDFCLLRLLGDGCRPIRQDFFAGGTTPSVPGYVHGRTNPGVL
jgi:hypothetical protein